MANFIKLKQGVEANRLGYTPVSGEPLWTTDEKKLFIGDGTTAGGVAIAMAGDSISLTQKGANNGIATLDSTGKIPESQLPALAISDTFVVADITARDGLTVEKGDVAIVTDAGSGEPQSYIYDGTVWQELKTPADKVTSVAGKTGVVTLVTTDLTDVDNTAPTDQQVMTWDGATSKWKANTIPSGVTTFSALSDTDALAVDEADKFLVVNSAGDKVTYTNTIDGGTF